MARDLRALAGIATHFEVLRTRTAGERTKERRSTDFFACRKLSGQEERLHQFSLSTDDHAGKSLEPFAIWDVRLSVKPRNE
jgi:hypothetical protein